ncbi:bacteriocin-like protein [Chitinophaga niastensis]|uniref:Bacteriocin-like protein n=1 Tax=Chitinophaga niastensis TaxID=536980 RepID=A0A2P8HVN9_CHINA|nr:class I lanthipeptide [Chitinophaga niastensis]PSL50292.1 bacteriocin-like protein [Chitinophaga niastensis]
MKKLVLNPLALDKETIAKLDENQLQEIIGGATVELEATSTGCGTGGSTCAAEDPTA